MDVFDVMSVDCILLVAQPLLKLLCKHLSRLVLAHLPSVYLFPAIVGLGLSKAGLGEHGCKILHKFLFLLLLLAL